MADTEHTIKLSDIMELQGYLFSIAHCAVKMDTVMGHSANGSESFIADNAKKAHDLLRKTQGLEPIDWDVIK